MVYTHLQVTITCKVWDNHATIHRQREAKEQGRLKGALHESPWEAEVE